MSNDTTDRAAHLLNLMKRGDDAFNARDFAAMDAVHHEDMVAHIAGDPAPTRGLEAHRAKMATMFEMFPDVRVHNDPYPVQYSDGDWTTVVTRVTGTFSGSLTLPDGTVIPGTGRPFDLAFGTTARWENDLLVEESVFWDTEEQARQIGLAG